MLAELARLFFATLGGVVLIYLVIDFADRAHTYTGRAWGWAAAELYANKAAVVSYQLAPVALIIATSLLVTLLSRRGELTALFALGVRPLRLLAPIAAFAAGPGRWRFLEAVETRYELYGGPGGTISERRVDVLIELFPETPADLELRSGRPRQLPWRQLREQLRRREKGGQRAREYEAALAERAATPVHVIPAALAAFGLTLKLQRPRRRLPLAGAVALGMGLSMVLWAASVIAHAIA